MIALLCLLLFANLACDNEVEIKKPDLLLCFYPYTGNLTTYFQQNIRDMEQSLTDEDLRQTALRVWIAPSAELAYLYEISLRQGMIVHDTLAVYRFAHYDYTNTAELAQILTDAQRNHRPQRFSLLIGAHGDAWVPAQDLRRAPARRSFGGQTEDSRIDIDTLRQALTRVGLQADYILFDDCYMASVEVAYALRKVCRHIIASPAEILATGMPYRMMAADLMRRNYFSICRKFYDYYSVAPDPYGAISVIDCQQLDSLAALLRDLPSTAAQPSSTTLQQAVQTYDGFSPHLFYDLGDYVRSICADEEWLKLFEAQLNQVVPYSAHTPSVWAQGYGAIPIHYYSGITTSAPSQHPRAHAYSHTDWAKAIQ